MLDHSPHAMYPAPQSKPIPPIIINIVISGGTGLSKSFYSLDHVQKIFDYFNQNEPGNFLNHINAKSFIHYLEKASNYSIQYIKACPQDPKCNPEKRLEEEFSFLGKIMIFLNQKISENNNPEKRSFAEASLRLQGNEIKNLIFDLAEQTRTGQFSNLTQNAQQRIVGEFFARLPEDCLNIIYGLVPHKITSSTVTSTSSTVQKIITSPPPTSEQTISSTTHSPLNTSSTFQHTSPSSRFFSTRDSIILNSTSITTANASTGEINTTASTPNLGLDFSESSLISWKSGLASTGSGIAAATVNKLVEQSLAALAPRVSAGNLKKLEYLIALLQAIVTSCSIYLTQYSVDSIEGAENNQNQLLFSLTFLLCSTVELASVCFGKNNIFTKTLSYSAALLPAVIGSYSSLKLLQGFAIHSIAYLGSYQVLNWLSPSKKTINEEQEQLELRPATSQADEDNIDETASFLDVKVEKIPEQQAKSSAEPDNKSGETDKLISDNGYSSASANTSCDGRNSTNSTILTDSSSITTDNSSPSISVNLEDAHPFYSVKQLEELQNTLKSLIAKVNKEKVLANTAVKTHDGSVSTALSYIETFYKDKKLKKFLKSVDAELVYYQNLDKIADKLREFNHIQSILTEIAVHNTNQDIDSDLQTLLTIIRGKTDHVKVSPAQTGQNLRKTTTPPSVNNTTRSVLLSAEVLERLQKDWQHLQQLLSKNKCFESEVANINRYLHSPELLDSSVRFFVNDKAMLEDNRTPVVRSYLSQITNHLKDISTKLSNLSKKEAKKACLDVISMQSTIERITRLLECKNVVVETTKKMEGRIERKLQEHMGEQIKGLQETIKKLEDELRVITQGNFITRPKDSFNRKTRSVMLFSPTHTQYSHSTNQPVYQQPIPFNRVP